MNQPLDLFVWQMLTDCTSGRSAQSPWTECHRRRFLPWLSPRSLGTRSTRPSIVRFCRLYLFLGQQFEDDAGKTLTSFDVHQGTVESEVAQLALPSESIPKCHLDGRYVRLHNCEGLGPIMSAAFHERNGEEIRSS